ncbi:MAG: NFACT family protein, partial [Vicinamibacteria bacterium]
MDRLFLKNLVEELSPRVRGRRIRGASLDREARILSLFLGPPGSHRLVWSFLPEAAGVHLLEATRPPKGGEATPALKKWLGGSTISGLAVADLDRIATLTFGGTRLSGRTTSARLVLELIATRADLYLIEKESSTILDAFSSSRPRLASGETYRAPPPPPQAAVLASNVAQFEERLSRRSSLLAASGATPLLVREMRWLIEREGRSESEAFARIRARLEEK